MKLFVYRNVLKDATLAENNGCSTLEFWPLDASNNGHDDFDSTVIGTLTVGDQWHLAIAQDGGVLFENSDGRLIRPTGEYGEGITALARKYDGFAFEYEIDPEAVDLKTLDEFQRLSDDFLAQFN